MELEGIGVTPEKGVGNVYFYEEEELSFEKSSNRTVKEEKERFESAREEAEHQLKEKTEKAEKETSGSESEIFEAHIQFLKDPQINSNVEENIEESLTAEQSVKSGFEQPIKQLESQEGRMKERADDLRDIRDNLIRILSGKEKQGLSNLPKDSVIVAENLKPSDTAEIDKSKVNGIVTAKGSKTSHVAILSKSMGIPAVVGVEDIDDLKNSGKILVDGIDGKVVVDPSQEQVREAEKETKAEVISHEVETSDDKRIEVAANVAKPADVSEAANNGADGIGLYRTEFMFLEREEPPSEEEHYENYVEALKKFPEQRVVVRTMDIGGDKSVPYLDLEKTENPFLGLRGIRLANEKGEELFKTQIKALLRASAAENGGNLCIMFPMISSVEEFQNAIDKTEELKSELEKEGKEFGDPEIGLMIETPSAVQMANELAEKADFLSIGTNDLTQYTMAASRTDSKVSDLQDPLYPSVLRSIKQTTEAAHSEDAWVGMCGEMAGNPELTELLIGMGLDELSMSSKLVPRVKKNVESISAEEANKISRKAIESSTREKVKEII